MIYKRVILLVIATLNFQFQFEQNQAMSTDGKPKLRRSYSSLGHITLEPGTPGEQLVKAASSTKLPNLSNQEVDLSHFLSIILQEPETEVSKKFSLNGTSLYPNPVWKEDDEKHHYVCLSTNEGLRIVMPKTYILVFPSFKKCMPTTNKVIDCFKCLFCCGRKRLATLCFTPLITPKTQRLFSNKVLISMCFLIKYVIEELQQNSEDQVVSNATKKITQAYKGLLEAGYNPTQLLRDCIAFARILKEPLIQAPLEMVAHNFQLYLELL